jgi:hypothetical protein
MMKKKKKRMKRYLNSIFIVKNREGADACAIVRSQLLTVVRTSSDKMLCLRLPAASS